MDTWRHLRVLAVVLIIPVGLSAIGATVLHAQQPAKEPPQQPAPIFRAGVNLVRVDVSVTSRGGTPVNDLTAEDLEITEDGLPQTVQTVQFVHLDGQTRAGDDESLEIRSPEHAVAEAARDDVRLFALFLDDYHIPKGPAVNIPLRRALVSFVEQLGPTDLITIMDPLTPLSALEFTRDKRALIDRIRAFEGRRGELFPVRSAVEEAQLSRGDVGRLRAEVTLSALEALVTYLGGLSEGRKSVLFVSQGPPFGRIGDEVELCLRDTLQAANRANVTINVLDPSGLGSRTSDSLYRLADETGGRRIVNTNDFTGGLARVIAEASAYYLVGYAPARDFADGTFHRIQVRVRRRGVQVVARRGYWAPKAADLTAMTAPASPTVPGLGGALTNLASPGARRPVDLWVGFELGAAGLTRLTVVWERASGATATLPAPARLEVEQVDSKDEPVPDIEPVTAVAGRDVGPAAVTLALLPGPSRLRFTVRAADDRVVDRWTQAYDVPALGREPLALSTLRFLRARSILEMRALVANPRPTPAAGRAFRRTDRLFVDVDCYAAADDRPVLAAQLLNGAGQRLLELAALALVEGTARVELPLANLAPGTYLVRVQARMGERQVEQLGAFRVVP